MKMKKHNHMRMGKRGRIENVGGMLMFSDDSMKSW